MNKRNKDKFSKPARDQTNTSKRVAKEANDYASQSERNRAAYQRRKAAGYYYAKKLENKTQFWIDMGIKIGSYIRA